MGGVPELADLEIAPVHVAQVIALCNQDLVVLLCGIDGFLEVFHGRCGRQAVGAGGPGRGADVVRLALGRGNGCGDALQEAGAGRCGGTAAGVVVPGEIPETFLRSLLGLVLQGLQVQLRMGEGGGGDHQQDGRCDSFDAHLVGCFMVIQSWMVPGSLSQT